MRGSTGSTGHPGPDRIIPWADGPRSGTAERVIPGAGASLSHPGGASEPAERWFENPRRRDTLPIVESKANRPSFEDALAQLEKIVESMEAGETPLAELLAKFEEGNKLLKVCETRLKDAELKIEQLRKQKDGVAFEKLAPGA